MHRRICLLLCAGLLLLTGCWDRVEVNDLGVVRIVGIDRAEAGVRVSIRMLIPTRATKEAGARGMITSIYSADGETIRDAVTRLQEKASRRLFWAHSGPIVIGEELAREGVRPVLDFWTRHREPRPTVLVAVVQGTALDFLQSQPALERAVAESVREIINTRLQVRVSMVRFLEGMRTPGAHPVAPRLRAVPGFPGGPEREVQVSGTAIFKDDRLIGWLEEDETRGLLWLRNEVGPGVITVSIPHGGKVSVETARGRTAVRPVFRQGKLRLAVSIRSEHELQENTAALDLDKPEVIEQVQGLLEQALRQRIRQTLDRVQHEFQVDALKFGEAVRRGAPVAWEQRLKARWSEEFPKVPVDLSITCRIVRNGKEGAPLAVTE